MEVRTKPWTNRNSLWRHSPCESPASGVPQQLNENKRFEFEEYSKVTTGQIHGNLLPETAALALY